MPIAWIKAGNRKPRTTHPTSPRADQGTITYERFVPHHGHFDTEDSAEDLTFWTCLRPELELWQQRVLRVYRDADDAALDHQKWHRRITLAAVIPGACAVLAA